MLWRHPLICYHSSTAESQGQIHQHGLAAALEVLAFALCCPGEAIKTVSARWSSVNDHTRHRDLDQSKIHSLCFSFQSATAAHSDRHYSLLPVSDFQALLGLLVWRRRLQQKGGQLQKQTTRQKIKAKINEPFSPPCCISITLIRWRKMFPLPVL